MNFHLQTPLNPIEINQLEIDNKIRSFKNYDNFDRMSQYFESNTNSLFKSNEKMELYFMHKIHNHNEKCMRRIWIKNCFVIIFLIKKFINKLKRNAPFSRFSMNTKQIEMINDQAYFFYGSGKIRKSQKKSKIHKVFPLKNKNFCFLDPKENYQIVEQSKKIYKT